MKFKKLILTAVLIISAFVFSACGGNDTTDTAIKSKAHYSMAQIYDDVNQITPALNHYVSAVSHAGEAENLPAQSAS